MPDGPSEPEPRRALRVQLFALAGSLQLSNESLPGTLFFSLAFLNPSAHPGPLLLLPLMSFLASHLLLLPVAHVAPRMLMCGRAEAFPVCVGIQPHSSLIPAPRAVPVQ